MFRRKREGHLRLPALDWSLSNVMVLAVRGIPAAYLLTPVFRERGWLVALTAFREPGPSLRGFSQAWFLGEQSCVVYAARSVSPAPPMSMRYTP